MHPTLLYCSYSPVSFNMIRLSGLSLIGCLLAIAPGAVGQEWTRFRGPNGSGVSRARTVPARWTEEDYNWKVKLPGVGHSSPVLWGEKIFLTSGEPQTGEQVVLCINTADGRQLWSRRFKASKHSQHKLNSYASSTPTVDERHVYICWGTPQEFIVTALDHRGGEAWRIDLGPFKASHGFGASPILWDDLLIVPNQQNGNSSVVALDRHSGTIRWQIERESRAAYSTPCIFQPRGRPPVLIFTNWRDGISAIDPKTGKIRWRTDVFDEGHVEAAIGSPVVAGELVLGVCGWLGVRQEVIAVRPPSAEPVYCIDRSAPLCTTPLVKDDLLLLWSDKGIVTCADVSTGKVHWRKRVGGTYYASPVCVADRVYNVNVDGDVLVLAADKQYKLLARNRLGEPSHSTPAVAGGVMYLRTFSSLFSIGGKSRRERASTRLSAWAADATAEPPLR